MNNSNHILIRDMEVGKKYYGSNIQLVYICCLDSLGRKVAICIQDNRGYSFSYNVGLVVPDHDLSHFYPVIEQKAYMVSVEGGKAPDYIHPFLSEANKEAERLALHNPNRDIRVLEVVRKLRCEVKTITKMVELKDDVIQF